jgi:organic radical activating enzyme
VGCHWCDERKLECRVASSNRIDLIVQNASKYAETVVVTGGEPLMWDMSLLTNKLKDVGRKVHIETSEAYPLSGTWDWICLSPKKNKLPTETVYNAAHELKVIIHNKHDFVFAEEQAELVNNEAILFYNLSGAKEMTPLIVDYVMKNPKWRVSLQTHKYLNIP